MAKNVSLSDALAAIESAGISFNAEQTAALEELKSAAFRQPAVEIFEGNGENLPGKLVEDAASDGEAWVTHLFSLAEEFYTDVVADLNRKVQGGAIRDVRVVGIDTPHGHLKIELRS
jgi:hypothetical protein